MTRIEFETVAREQNQQREREVSEARTEQKPCDVVDMLAFGGIPYCRAHGVMGPCPYGATR